MARVIVPGHWNRHGRAEPDRICCDGRCQQGRSCPLNAARVEAAKPRPQVQQRPRLDTTNTACWSVALVVVIAMACAVVHVIARVAA